MAVRLRNTDDLLEVFAAMISAPPPEHTALLVRHLQCKESVALTRILADAIPRYVEHGGQRLPPPSELLPPLA